MKLSLKLLLSLFLLNAALKSQAQAVYDSRSIDFTRSTTAGSGYTKSFYLDDFGNDLTHNGVTTISTSEASRMNTESNTWRIKLLANKIGDDGGMWSSTAIGKSITTKVLQYDVKFGYTSNPFDWGIGGKIPGLGGGKNYTGCVSTKAGDGWTSRVMWRTATDGKAYLMPYVYYVDKPSTCGDDFGNKYFGNDGSGLVGGRWYRIKMKIALNTGTSYNGQLEITIQDNINGTWTEAKTLINKQNIRYAITVDGLEIDQLLTGVYRGGSTTDWASPTDGYIFLDNLSWDTDDKSLPIKLATFYLTENPAGNKLKWTTLEEKNVDYFEILKSSDKGIFQSIGRQKATNSPNGSSYIFTDNSKVYHKKSYYKLRTVDLNGDVEDSKVIESTILFDQTSSFYPNPFEDSFSINLNLEQECDVSVSLINGSGVSLMNQLFHLQKGSQTLRVKPDVKLKKGAYVVSVKTPEKSLIFKAIKQ